MTQHPSSGVGAARPFLLGQLARDLGAVVGAEHVSSEAGDLAEQSADWSWMSQFLRHRDLPLPVADVVVRSH